MTSTPLYKVPSGSRLVLEGRHWLVTGREEYGYAVEGVEDGECLTLSYARVDSAIKERVCEVIKPADAEVREALVKFTGGLEIFEQLSPEQQDTVRARLAIVTAMDELEAEGLRLTQRSISEKGALRSTLLNRATELSKGRKFIEAARGGKFKRLFQCPQGRTLARYRQNYHRYGRNPVALIDRDHLKGRPAERLSYLQERFIDYIIEQWNRVEKPTLATLVEDAKPVFHVPPEQIADGFKFPSITTIRARIKAMSEVVKAIGRSGVRHATNLKGAGSTDVRALMYGEKAEIDQVYLSIFTDDSGAVRSRVINPNEVDEDLAENEIRRLWLHAMFDVATHLPLASIIAETADADHSQALLRMATRDKTREKVRYECKRDPAPAVHIAMATADNGSATRNGAIYASQLGMGTVVELGRAYHATDKPCVERAFGTMQWQVLNFLPGYTGSRPGELEGYEPKKSAKLTRDQLYGIITRFLVDDYSHSEHRGTGMFNATPWEKLEEAVSVYGGIDAPSQMRRCLHLGVKTQASTTSEGVLAFYLPFNSTELQRYAGGTSKRVTIHMDPDDLRKAYVTAEKHDKVIEVDLRMTALQDLTLEEAIEVMEAACRRDPKAQELHDRHLHEVRKRFAQESGFFPDSRDPSNYQTMDKLRRRADRLAQVEMRPTGITGPTAPPGQVTDRSSGNHVFKVKKSGAPDQGIGDKKPSKSGQASFKPIKESML
ncbi:Integrase core domain protein [Roseivivax jejudonensis]|uniref:Integrase core domain protein n=1 Tax=Roseivivax jejudonensis TaxID=1529041 RepID=A0A1X6YP12_9RHOB|nr:hypothetical protein [Roseivivax jejudonensis]SLN26337.1 Integrase core domain protein [Roseivivax jejudonensis]